MAVPSVKFYGYRQGKDVLGCLNLLNYTILQNQGDVTSLTLG